MLRCLSPITHRYLTGDRADPSDGAGQVIIGGGAFFMNRQRVRPEVVLSILCNNPKGNNIIQLIKPIKLSKIFFMKYPNSCKAEYELSSKS